MPLATVQSDQNAADHQSVDSEAPPRVSWRRFGWLRIVLAVVATLAGLLLYASTIVRLIVLWNQDPNYSHGPLVPLASLFFAWLAFKQGPAESPERPATAQEVSRGFALITSSLVLHFMAWITNQSFVDVFSVVLLLWGVAFVVGGAVAWRRYRFAAIFLLFMAPLPPLLLLTATTALQQFVAASSTLILQLASVAVFREGYLVHLSGFTMEVGQACSGMRQLVTFAALGAAVGYLSRRGWKFTLLALMLSLVCAVVANLLRVLLTALVLATAGPEYASGVFHTLEGLVTFLIGGAMLLGACLGVARLIDQTHRGEAVQ